MDTEASGEWNKSVVLSRQECREPEAFSDGNLGSDVILTPHGRDNVTRYEAHAHASSFRSKIPKGHLYNINVMRYSGKTRGIEQ